MGLAKREYGRQLDHERWAAKRLEVEKLAGSGLDRISVSPSGMIQNRLPSFNKTSQYEHVTHQIPPVPG